LIIINIILNILHLQISGVCISRDGGHSRIGNIVGGGRCFRGDELGPNCDLPGCYHHYSAVRSTHAIIQKEISLSKLRLWKQSLTSAADIHVKFNLRQKFLEVGIQLNQG
jgi:hypothetical protein